MAEIDTHSSTWKAVCRFAELQHREAVGSLIVDHDSERQRGKIELLVALLALAEEPALPKVRIDTYST